jgi:hypothetical protein
MTALDASEFARALVDGLTDPATGLVEEDRRDLMRIVGHELSLQRATDTHYEQIAALARVILADPEREMEPADYDTHPLRRPDDPDSEQLRGWYGSWRVALITAVRWIASPNRGIQSRLRSTSRREHWTKEEAAVRLRDAAGDLKVARCVDMSSREYAELSELYWQRRRLPGTHPKRVPDRQWLVERFGSFEAACEFADDHLGIGEEGGQDGN